MSVVFLVFPHQLFEINLHKPKGLTFILIEEPLFFSQYSFHTQKLILHRASMKYYVDALTQRGHTVYYFEDKILKENSASLNKFLTSISTKEVRYFDVVDDWLEQKIRNNYTAGFMCTVEETPMFLSSKTFLDEEFLGKKHFSMASFYSKQRKEMNILVEKNGKPVGGKWSFDTENRRKMPKDVIPPSIPKFEDNKYVKEAKRYVSEYFSDNPGNPENFNYATTHDEAKRCLDDFLINRFALFGAYEDSIAIQYTHLFHSCLSAYLNNGLLTPIEVIDEALKFSQSNYVPLNSLEGFIRQIIGWREYMRGIYLYKGRRERTFNFWDHKRKLPYTFWKGVTNLEPLDIVIQRVLQNAYCHHIERLMIMGNFMLLAEIDPDDCYKWFMEMYIDAYDWVMVSNVYSMSQYAGGGTSTTKPYLSSSNYILKMSNIKKGKWADVWNALYWRFIYQYREFFQSNPRLNTMTLHLNKMKSEILKDHIKTAELFLKDFK